MRVRDEIRLAFAALLVVQVLTSFAAIGVLTRMGPAIERILKENVYTMEAVEEMLGILASRDGAVLQSDQERFVAALSRAQNNVTEAEEPAILAVIVKHKDAALSGDVAAVREVSTALIRLGEVNRVSVRKTAENARRMGQAGAWAVVFLGSLGFFLAIRAGRRLSRRILEPLVQVYATIEAHRAGDVHRRCRVTKAPPEIETLARTLNDLFEERQENQENQESQERTPRSVQLDRAFVLWALDRMPGPAAVIASDGALMALNAAAAGELKKHGSALRERLRRAASKGQAGSELKVEDLRGQGHLVTWKPAPASRRGA